jgi:predicted DCC family thiol-disulfide oxidoreductase YuxK
VKTCSVSDGGCAILFVDGDCVLCRRLSRLVVDADAAGRLRVAPLDGVTARRLLSLADRTQGDWVVLVEGPRTMRAADAVVRTLGLMGGRFGVMGRVMRLLPRPLRDAAYRFVARRRRAWFGRVESCPLPASEQRPDAVLD